MGDVMGSVVVGADDTCVVRARFDPRLREALRAIPGRRWHPEEGAWSVRIGPDRAEAVRRLLESFPGLRATREGHAALHARVAGRDRARPVIERVVIEGMPHLSVCLDWEHPVVDELLELPDVIDHRSVGRVSVPIWQGSEGDLSELLSRHSVRLSPHAHQDLGHPRGLRVAGPGLAAPARQTRRAPQRPWRAEVATAVMGNEPWFAVTTTAGRPPEALRSVSGAKRVHSTWLVPMVGAARTALETLLEQHPHLRIERSTMRCLEVLDSLGDDEAPPPALLTADEDGEAFELEPLWDGAVVAAATRGMELLDRRAPRARLRADAWSAPSVASLAAEHRLGLDGAARRLLDELQREHEAAGPLVDLSQAADADLTIDRLGGELMAFQRAGVAYALQQRRTFIADEQGLGKTVEALAALEAAGAFPAVIVCPASLKLNWARETRRWLPHRSHRLLSGRSSAVPAMAEVTIVNYDVLDAHVEALATENPQALVLDEAHYCKNPRAKRTKAAVALSEGLAPEAMRLALTGTPLVNRPRELVPQLRILGRLSDFESGASFERAYSGAAARERLHWHLRRRCYVRRRKADVLPQLPAKRRVTVPVPLSNQAEYERLEKDLITWIRDQVSDLEALTRRIDNAMRARALVKLNALRHVAAHGKLEASLEWIAAFLASGEKLVVFAHHRDVQHALLAAMPDAARIVGDDALEDRDENVRRFQSADGPQVCVCSLEAASHGFTLTGASNVAFLELGWTPAKHDQAEDRVHRIGQDRRVTAYYLLAADTIDERIAALIDHKRAVVGSITDGTSASEEAVVDRLLRELAGRD